MLGHSSISTTEINTLKVTLIIFYKLNSAYMVSLPTFPSTVNPLFDWNLFTEVVVPEPKIPSTPFGLKLLQYNILCIT